MEPFGRAESPRACFAQGNAFALSLAAVQKGLHPSLLPHPDKHLGGSPSGGHLGMDALAMARSWAMPIRSVNGAEILGHWGGVMVAHQYYASG